MKLVLPGHLCPLFFKFQKLEWSTDEVRVFNTFYFEVVNPTVLPLQRQ